MAEQFDVIVIGAGAVGENVAERAVKGGMKTAIVEAELVGGECSYWACMPSKALLRSGAMLRAAQKVGGVKQAITGDLDVAAVLRRRDEMTSHWSDAGQVEWVDGAGIELVRGHAEFTGPRQLTVTDAHGETRQLAATHAVAICTGSASLLPDIPGLQDAHPWTSRDATSAKEVPDSLAIIGGGVVACEMATAYASFGTSVHLISRSGLLAGQEPFAGELVADSLRDLGVEVHLQTSPTRVERTPGAGVTLSFDGEPDVTVSEVLVATGRIPRTADLGLKALGLTGGDWLTVDDSMRVLDASGSPVGDGALYAVGDVNHRALLTHQGKYQARIAGDVIAARAKGADPEITDWGTYSATADHTAVPQVTFTDPEVASVGLTEKKAREAGIDVRVVDYDLAGVAGASIAADGYVGKARMIVDEQRHVIVGLTFVGADVGEMLHSATIAVVGEVPIDRLWHAVPSYPTLSEVWLRLLETYGRPSA